MPNFTAKNQRLAAASIFTAELDALANDGLVLSSVIDVDDAAYALYLRALAELVVTFGTAPTANTGISVWLLETVDDTNYADGDASVTPARAPDLVLPVRAVTTAQRVIMPCFLPPTDFKVLLQNDGTGQAFAASGNTFKLRPFTQQIVQQ